MKLSPTGEFFYVPRLAALKLVLMKLKWFVLCLFIEPKNACYIFPLKNSMTDFEGHFNSYMMRNFDRLFLANLVLFRMAFFDWLLNADFLVVNFLTY